MQDHKAAATEAAHTQQLVNILSHVDDFERLETDNKNLIITYGPPGVGKSVVLQNFLKTNFKDRKELIDKKSWYNGSIDDLVNQHSGAVRSWIKIEKDLKESRPDLKLVNSKVFRDYVTRKRTQTYFEARKDKEGLDELNDTLMQAALDLGAGILMETTGAYGRGWNALQGLLWVCSLARQKGYTIFILCPLTSLQNVRTRLAARKGQLNAHNPEELFRSSYANLLYEILPSYKIIADSLLVIDNNIAAPRKWRYLHTSSNFSQRITMSGEQSEQTLQLVNKMNKLYFIRGLGKATCNQLTCEEPSLARQDSAITRNVGSKRLCARHFVPFITKCLQITVEELI